MTESRRSRRPGFGPVLLGSLALFAVLFALLTYELAAATEPAQRPVLRRKVIKRRVVTTVVPSAEESSASAGSVTSTAPEESFAPEETYSPPPVTTGAS